MRLTGKLKQIIQTTIIEVFGSVDAILFGSRTNDSLSGGDIDIAIKTEISSSEFKQYKINFITKLARKGFDIKIDLIQYHSTMNFLLKKEIQQEGQLLSNVEK